MGIRDMAITKEGAQQKVKVLMAKYNSLDARAIKRYDEANTRKDFIMPFFEGLGWDTRNREEVCEEARVSRQRVDYSFRLKGATKFFVEAKALKVDLDDAKWAQQVIDYAYHKGVTWAVLTDFEGLKVFNAEWHEDNIAKNLLFEIPCQEYEERFDQLWFLSKEAMQEDLLDKEAAKWGRKRSRTPVGEQLFKDLVEWRGVLHKYLSKYNKERRGYEIDEAVQRILDRLIFIRTCEDRGLEDHTLWPLLQEPEHLLSQLRNVCTDFNNSYDSRLFLPHLADELDCEATPFLEVIERLYTSRDGVIRYDFNAIDADVLGGIYEQYLGHLLKRAGEEVEVISERGKRKAHGIYYTPKFVVRYIVENTLGRALDGKSLNEAKKIRILDPACGSGSFLVEALDYLERHWRRQGWVPEGGEQADFFDYLTRVQFLIENLYGVDVDAQAVEIAQLNLMLKSAYQRSLLPDLKDNIRQGNSLISGTEAELRRYFGDKWEDKHRFNWEEQFDKIKPEGRFDVIIGNPPYVRIQSLPREDADYYRDRFESAFGSFDIYVLFLEKAVELLKPGGRLGFIASGKFLKAEYGKRIQQVLHESCTVENIVDLSAQQVFADSTTYPAIIVIRKGKGDEPLSYTLVPGNLLISGTTKQVDLAALPTVKAAQEAVVKGVWPPVSAVGDSLLEKLSAVSVQLRDLADRVFVGLQTSADNIYILEKRGEPKEGLIKVYSRALGQEWELESALLKPLLSGKDVDRYGYPLPDRLILFPYKVVEDKAELIPPTEFASAYPKCWEYLLQNRAALEDREGGKMRHERWYAFGRTQNLALHDRRKMAIPRLVKRLAAVYDQTGNFYLDNVDVGGLILKEESDAHYSYVLGLLNSPLLNLYFRRISVPFRGGFYSANRQFLEPLPIRRIDFKNPEEKKMHDKLVALVERMLELNKRLAPIRNTPCNERDEIMREIERTDRKIDNLVYDLYGLTDEERQIVEEQTKEGGT